MTAPSVSKEVQAFHTKLTRFKEARKLFDLVDKAALETTEKAILAAASKLKIANHIALLDKVELEIGRYDFSDNSICKQMFVSNLNQHPKYQEKVYQLLSPIYSLLIEQVLAHRGKVLEEPTIHSLIDSALAETKGKAKDHSLHVHNWTVEKYDPEATITIDWSPYFNRQKRMVPGPEVWNAQLIPQLYAVRESLLKETTNRHIIFRGKCALSTGLTLGMVFPEIGNWTFELQQPSHPTAWRSDAVRIDNYELKYEVVEPVSLGVKEGLDENVVVFNIAGRAFEDVVSYLKENAFRVRTIIMIQPKNSPGGLSIVNDSEAASLASASKDIIKAMLSKHRANKTHLFFYGPIGLAIFLGQKLTAVGKIQLYEFQDPGYKPSCLMNT